MSSVTHFIRELTLFGSLSSAKGVTRITVNFYELLGCMARFKHIDRPSKRISPPTQVYCLFLAHDGEDKI